MIPLAHCVPKPMRENDGQVSVTCLFQIPSAWLGGQGGWCVWAWICVLMECPVSPQGCY